MTQVHVPFLSACGIRSSPGCDDLLAAVHLPAGRSYDVVWCSYRRQRGETRYVAIGMQTCSERLHERLCTSILDDKPRAQSLTANIHSKNCTRLHKMVPEIDQWTDCSPFPMPYLKRSARILVQQEVKQGDGLAIGPGPTTRSFVLT